MSQYRQHADITGLPRNRRADALRDIVLACAIGISLGLVLAWGI